MAHGPTHPYTPSNPANLTPPGTKPPKPKKTEIPNPDPTKGPSNTTSKTSFREIPLGPQDNWGAFLDGTYKRVPKGTTTGGLQTEPYVALAPTLNDPTPRSLVLLAAKDGKRYEFISIDDAVTSFSMGINNVNKQFYKQQLQQYYPSSKAYQTSLTQPVAETDLGFEAAVREALIAMSVENFDSASEFATAVAANPEYAATSNPNLFGFDTYVASRIQVPQKQSFSQRSSSLTTKADAIREFKRDVQLYVGDPLLVEKVDKLAEEYFNQLNKIELQRISTSFSTSDPITGLSTGGGTSWAPLAEVDRLEMRLKLIVNGNKKVVSAGIQNADPDALQDAGGLIGDNYTKLKEHAYKVGIKVDNAGLIKRVKESLLPGGTFPGTEGTAAGLEQQKKTLTLMAKAKYKNYANYFDSGLTFDDLSSEYRTLKEDEMELGKGAVDVFDSDVQDAFSGDLMMNTNDFLLKVRSNPNWRFTKKANESSAGFIDAILKMWGKV